MDLKAAIAYSSFIRFRMWPGAWPTKPASGAEIEFFGSLLPAHVSLKKTYAFDNMWMLEGWFDAFSQKVAPPCFEHVRVY